MIRFTAETSINRPVEEVFRFITEPLNYPKWMKGVSGAEPIPGTAAGIGSKVRVVGKVGPWKMDGPMEITEYEANHKVGITATIRGAMQFQAVWTFESTGPMTTHVSESGMAGLLGFWKLLEPLMAGEMKNGEAEELKKIKSLLEKQG
jgi:uncharacterized protein YndB with AHSA1/START domain